MSRTKLKKFAKLKIMSNVLQPEREELLHDNFKLKGKWNNKFGNNNPIILELGCGKGEYTVALAKKDPNYVYFLFTNQNLNIQLRKIMEWKLNFFNKVRKLRLKLNNFIHG